MFYMIHIIRFSNTHQHILDIHAFSYYSILYLHAQAHGITRIPDTALIGSICGQSSWSHELLDLSAPHSNLPRIIIYPSRTVRNPGTFTLSFILSISMISINTADCKHYSTRVCNSHDRLGELESGDLNPWVSLLRKVI